MARLAIRDSWRTTTVLSDCRGVVYVEFLIAFVPLFILFLGMCQLALLTTARIVVRQAAFSAVRSAVVVLEDSPKGYDGAPRGSLSAGSGGTGPAMQALLAGLAGISGKFSAPSLAAASATGGVQQGARMAPIRTAAYALLLSLAPREEDLVVPSSGSLGRSLAAGLEGRLAFAVDYTQAASSVTVHASTGDVPVATDPIGRNAEVVVRVTYFYPCGVPLVRALMCKSLDSLLGSAEPVSVFGIRVPAPETPLRSRLDFSEAPGALEAKAAKGSRFIVIDVEASLPNQGAGYYGPKDG